MAINPLLPPRDPGVALERPPRPRGRDLLHAAQAGGFSFAETRFHAPLPFHTHEGATLSLLLAGGYEESYRTRRALSFEPDSLLVRPSGEPHADRFTAGGALKVTIEIDAERERGLRDYRPVLEMLSHRRDPALGALARRMQRELASGDTAAELALEGLALELLALALRGPREDRRRDAAGHAPAWLARARELLHARSGDRALRVGELAVAADVHPVHLARAFRAHFGATPGAYLRQLRLTRAADALTLTDEPLSRIALDAGFADQSHFTRAFRARFGATPGRWRALHRR